jgi:predicted transcriptional regulator of viral defense system
MPRVASGHWLAKVADHCRAHGTITTRDVQTMTGYPMPRCINILVHQRRGGFVERVSPGVYRLTDRGLAWRPVTRRDAVLELCTDNRATAQVLRWKLGMSLETACWWLRRLHREGVVRRISLGVYGPVRSS